MVPTVQTLLDQGEATRGLEVKTRGGHLILGRLDEDGPDPRFRLTPLGDSRYGLSLYDRNRWDPLLYEGTLSELVDVINNDLAAWAAPAGPLHPYRASDFRSSVLSRSRKMSPGHESLTHE